jgi:nucleotide-binding universal stress UspA family protein
MQPFQTILFAADFSENSKAAFGVACRLATENTSRLVVLHVIEPDWVAKSSDYLGEGAVSPSETESLSAFLKQRMAEVYVPNRPLNVEFCASEGSAAPEIIRMADTVGADLIAMSTHGRTRLRQLLTGSVVSTVLIKAHCSVLGLRTGHVQHNADELRVILHPTDFSNASKAARSVAGSLARDHGARLIILHVAPVNAYLEGRLPAEFHPLYYQQSLDAIRKRLDGLGLMYPVETQLARGFEAEEILRVAQQIECDLIVMGTHGRTGLGRILMGNTAESVLPRADCPVLVVKASRVETSLASERAPTGEQTASARTSQESGIQPCGSGRGLVRATTDERESVRDQQLQPEEIL